MTRANPSAPLYLVGYSTRAMAASARSAGYAPLSLDAFGDRDRGPGWTVPDFASRPEGLAQVLRTLMSLDPGIVVWGSPFENYPEALKQLAARHTLWGSSPAAVANVRNWSLLTRFAALHGVKVPVTVRGGRVPRNGSWLIKPVRSGGGHHILFAEHERAIPDGCVAQEYIVGHPVSYTFLADGVRVLGGFWTQSWAPGPDFRYRGGVLDLRGPIPGARAGQALAQHLVQAFGLRGWCGLDFVAAENALYVLEVNPRWTGSVELWDVAANASAFGATVEAMAGCPNPLPSLSTAAGKRIVRAPQDCRWRDPCPRIPGGQIHDLPWPGQPFESGQPVCTLIVSAPRPEDVRTRLDAWEEEVLAWLRAQDGRQTSRERRDVPRAMNSWFPR